MMICRKRYPITVVTLYTDCRKRGSVESSTLAIRMVILMIHSRQRFSHWPSARFPFGIASGRRSPQTDGGFPPRRIREAQGAPVAPGGRTDVPPPGDDTHDVHHINGPVVVQVITEVRRLAVPGPGDRLDVVHVTVHIAHQGRSWPARRLPWR